MSDHPDLATNLRLAYIDLLGAADLVQRVRQHPRFPELSREEDTPDHPAARLAAWIEEPLSAQTEKALRAALAWMDGEATE